MTQMSIPEQATTNAFNTWRNRPGRADPKLVREALLDAAEYAYEAGRREALLDAAASKRAKAKGDD